MAMTTSFSPFHMRSTGIGRVRRQIDTEKSLPVCFKKRLQLFCFVDTGIVYDKDDAFALVSFENRHQKTLEISGFTLRSRLTEKITRMNVNHAE
ncbi:hypothetical protein AF333_22475 [Aneurinibacillus migulanus]|uniref:Uncharacterized protein n=1 Tax=Aneurinibacillus migulanus TaxID=47500 RepID=A0A0M0H6S5_ANEMI|nr:hypothetical protein AF333_22475 [Aneurinibacillus migulanus]